MSFRSINRREFLATSATATAVLCASRRFVLANGTPEGVCRVNLDGQWLVRREGSQESLPARVPGCIHTDLLAAGKIPDPFFGDNERQVQWVGETNWVYRHTFEAPPELLNRARVLLRCEGLDTLATSKINGKEVGRANNMFRIWEFDAKSALKPGENTVEVAFASPLPYMKQRQAERALYEWSGPHEPRGRAWVRKEPCNFGWDWGPVLITCGIWRSISLVAFEHRLLEPLILQEHSSGKVRLHVQIPVESAQTTPLKVNLLLRLGAENVAGGSAKVVNGLAAVDLEIANPQLWWPAGMGEQPLYQIMAELIDAEGTAVERRTQRLGLRTLKLLEPGRRTSLRFEVNGIPFFAKGANWIPADAFANRVTPEMLRRYVVDAVAANMNMLRFWGGGYYEEDALFDACDELGICVWLDFKFACTSYPSFDAEFMENVRQEARDQIRRLRHHACIAVWCGNNEISLMTKAKWSDKSMGQADYDRLFKQLLGGQVKELAPEANFVSGSPDCGDVHYWQVWHGDKPFEAYRTQTGFMSEFGFQSFPEPKTVRSYTNEEDRTSVLTPVMQWHQRSAGQGNQRIQETTLRYFNPPKDFENALWLSQILQAYGVKIGAEHWRRTMPQSMGCLFWQYNDCWPVASWSSVDYFGRWKALQYFARRFYAPFLVSAVEDSSHGRMRIFVSSDCGESRRGKVSWEVTDAAGNGLSADALAVELPPRASKEVKTLDLQRELKEHNSSNVLLWLKLVVNDRVESENLAMFVPPKALPLADPQLETTAKKTEQGFEVTVTARHPALWCWLNLEGADARFSDNFVHVRAGAPARLLVIPANQMPETEFAKALRVQSLFETYDHVRKTS